MGAGVFHGRVRDGIGWIIPRHGHQVVRAIRPLRVGVVVRACGVGACLCVRVREGRAVCLSPAVLLACG